MLQTIHDKTSGLIATAIMLLLIIPFAFWGINYYFRGGKEPDVATVNGKEIKLNQYQRTYENFRSQMQATLKKPLTTADESFLKDETLRRMVDTELVHQTSVDSGIRVSDNQVRDAIKGINVFSGENGFNKEFYEQTVSRLGMPPAQYEHQMRQDMMSEQLQSAIVESEFATPLEIDTAARLINQQRDFKYTIIETRPLIDTVQVSDAEISDFYKQNSSLYKKPEEIKIAYLLLDMADLEKDVQVTDADLKAYYEENKGNFDKPEQRKITQILIKTDKKSDKEIKQATQEADKISAEIKSGKTFDDIAKEYAANKQIDFNLTELGFANKGALPKEVDKVAFSMNKGDVSDVIKESVGLFIIRLDDIRGGTTNSFESSRDDVEKAYRKKQAEQRFYDMADQLGTLAYEHPDSLDAAAQATGLTIKQSDYFSRNASGDELWKNRKIVDAGFSDDVLNNGHNSDAIELSDQKLVFIRVVDHTPESVKPLNEVRDTVINDVKSTKARKQVQETGDKIMADLKSGKDIATVSTTYDVKFADADGVKRDDISVNRSVLRNAFKVTDTKGSDGITGVSMGTGDYAVIVVTAIKNPDPDTVKQKKLEEIGKQMEAARSTVSWQEYIDTLKANADIKTYPDIIKN